MRRFLASTVLLLPTAAAAVIVTAQVPEKPPTFDVAAIKENKSGENDGRMGGPPSRFTATNMPALQLIVFAYDNTPTFRIENAPDWLRKERYDINARAEGNFPVARSGGTDSRTSMMRALLIDRFKLITHMESKQLPIYEMVLAKVDKSLGPQIYPTNTDCAALIASFNRGRGPQSPPLTQDGAPDCGGRWVPGKVTFGTQPMAQLAATLSQVLQRTVVDHTGLTGTYSATLTWTPDRTTQGERDAELPQVDQIGPSLFTAIQEQLGLKLVSTRGAVDVLVIDHVERPTPD